MIYIWAVGIYLAFLVAISVYKSRQIKTQDDFMVAGRGVTAAFLVGTLVCTWIGSGSLFGGAGRAFRHGFSALWMSAGAWLGLIIVYYLAPRVRRIAQYTVPDILETRYNASSRLLGSFAIIIAYLTIASYQFIGGGRLVSILTEGRIDPIQGQLMVAALVVLYTVLAGMTSIVALDLANGIMITLGVIIAAPLALKAAGGWSQLTQTLPETHFTTFGSLGSHPGPGPLSAHLHAAPGRELDLPEVHVRQGRGFGAPRRHRHGRRCGRHRDRARLGGDLRRRHLLERPGLP